MTIQSDFETLIDELETNLQAMGVHDAEFDATTGIRGLVARIVDINPSLTGIGLTTAISCSSSHQTVVIGNTITITGVLTATYDDQSVTNVDLSGYLQGATINIYNGETLLGTAITDSNGTYTFSYTTNAVTNLSIFAQFDGTDDYSSCSSSNVAISVIGELTLTSNKNILGAVDNETATLTAHLADIIIENVSINFYKESNNMAKTLIGTATTDANGVATITYAATDAGDVTIQAESSNLSSNSCAIRTVYYANTGTTDKTSDFDLSNVWVSKNSSQGTITFTNDNGWIQASRVGGGQYAFVPISKLTGLNQAFKMSMIVDYSGSDTSSYTGLYAENYQAGMFQWHPFRIVQLHTGSSDGWSVYTSDSGVYGSIFKYEVVFDGTSFTHYAYSLDGTLIKSKNWTMPSELNNKNHTVRYGIHMEYGRKIRFKDLIVELL